MEALDIKLLGREYRVGCKPEEREGLLAFIEVKARPSLAEAAAALGPRQRARLVAAAECWLAENPGHGVAGIRFDVLLVAADGAVRRIADAFRVEG